MTGRQAVFPAAIAAALVLAGVYQLAGAAVTLIAAGIGLWAATFALYDPAKRVDDPAVARQRRVWRSGR